MKDNKQPNDTVIFAPAAEIKNITHVIDRLNIAHWEFQKVAKAMDNLDTSIKYQVSRRKIDESRIKN